jgi:hypothetical protein
MPSPNTESAAVDYDFPPVAELEFGDTQYRVDAGMRSAVAVSGRALGTWTWQLLTEGRWDGVKLKANGVDREVVVALEKALRAASVVE